MRTNQAQVGQPAAIQNCCSWTSTFQTGQLALTSEDNRCKPTYSAEYMQKRIAIMEAQLAAAKAALARLAAL